jgi:hypothetical protein
MNSHNFDKLTVYVLALLVSTFSRGSIYHAGNREP